MDIDKPLDDMISDKKQASGGGRRQDKGDRPRPSRQGSDRAPARAAATPYARPPARSTEDKWVHDMGPRGGQGGGAGGRGSSFRGGEGNGVAGAGAGGPPIFTGVSPRILVSGVHYEVTAQDLKNIFSQAGTLVQGPTIRYDRSGRSTGEASMEFSSYQEAKIAINKYDGAMTKGQTISIRLLPPARRGPPGGAAAPVAAAGGRGGAAAGGAQSGESLLARMSNGGGGGGKAAGAQRGDAARGPARGPARDNAPRGRAAPAGGRGGGGAGGAGGRGGRRGPANETDLDKELDSFMKVEKSEDVKMD